MVRKEQFQEEVERVKARVKELKKGGVGDDEMAEALMREGFWPAAISKVMGVSGRIFAKYGRGGDFIRKIETMKKDERIPVLAKEIDDYAWWRAVCYDLGILSFYRISPLAGLDVGDQRDVKAASKKLSLLLQDMLEKGEKATVIQGEVEALRGENVTLKSEYATLKSTVDRWNAKAKELLPQLNMLKEKIADIIRKREAVNLNNTFT